MATSRGLGAFSKRMGVVAKAVFEDTEKKIKRAAIVADQALVLGTPVDTGRARANWIASVGSPTSLQLNSTDPGGSQAISQGLNTVQQWSIGEGSIFFTNSLPYIQRLDDGWSDQAPAGMTAAALQAASAELRRGGFLRKRI